MEEAGNLHPITEKDLEQHLAKVNEHMESINKGGLETPNLFNLVRDIGGDKHLMAKEVQDTLGSLRQGFSLYYEMYATLEDRIEKEKIDGGIEEKEKKEFLAAYSMFAAGSYIANKLDLMTEQEPIKGERRENYFKFNFTKDDTLNHVLARYYGTINMGKRKSVIEKGVDLPRASIEFFRFLRDEALSKKQTLNKKLVDLVSNIDFRIMEEYTVSGFEASFEAAQKDSKLEFIRKEPHEVSGNKLAKQEMLRDMDRIALYDPILKKNPIINVGGLGWSVLYYGLPGTGKTSLFIVGWTRVDKRLEQVNEFWKHKNAKPLPLYIIKIDPDVKDKYYGETGRKTKERVIETKRDDRINIGVIDDIDLLFSGDRNTESGGSDKDILNTLMQTFSGTDLTVRLRGNSQWWAATNDATTMDPALKQRFTIRYEVDGPQTWHDYADILYNELGPWIKRGTILLPAGKEYTPYEARKEESKYKSDDEGILSKIKGKFSGKEMTFRDIGELAAELKKKDERFTGRAVNSVAEAIKKRINDYEIPREWFEKPDLFFFKEYSERVKMLNDMCKKVNGNIIAEEFQRYFDLEQKYSSDKFKSDVEKTVHNLKVHEEAKKIVYVPPPGR